MTTSALWNGASLSRHQRFESRVGPNELSIPAIRAPEDGSLIYFVEPRRMPKNPL